MNNDIHYLQVEYMRTILKNELELPVIEISDASATLDGGDVLFTGENSGLQGLSMNRTQNVAVNCFIKYILNGCLQYEGVKQCQVQWDALLTCSLKNCPLSRTVVRKSGLGINKALIVPLERKVHFQC